MTLGIIVYNLRNSQIYGATIHRGKFLETILSLPPNDVKELCEGHAAGTPPDRGPGGIFVRRPKGTGTFFLVPIKHDWGTAIIYSSVLGGGVSLPTRPSRS